MGIFFRFAGIVAMFGRKWLCGDIDDTRIIIIIIHMVRGNEFIFIDDHRKWRRRRAQVMNPEFVVCIRNGAPTGMCWMWSIWKICILTGKLFRLYDIFGRVQITNQRLNMLVTAHVLVMVRHCRNVSK